ncbi:glycosyltransferase [Sphingomonas sp. CARO-RG-8B-R24-01]|uniref:glycosyltransferase n=1 Tax=Sphingomonas sp. CARO-RG-8B-R24-01 TaxID=2914831 RepID=UPI001F5A685F
MTASATPATDPSARPLRILTFLKSFDPGGVEKVAIRLAEAWHDEGAVVHVLMGEDRGAMRDTAPSLSYAFCTTAEKPRRSRPSLRLLARLPMTVRQFRPDVIFVAGNTYAGIAVALKLLLGSACPPIALKVSNDLERADMPPVLRAAYRQWLRIQGRFVDQFVGMAEANRPELTAAFGVTDDRVSIVHDPAVSQEQVRRMARLRSVPAMASGRRFLAVGRLVPQKNFVLLVHAFADVACAGDELVILGEGPSRDRILQTAAERGVRDQVLMPGHGDPSAWLAQSDLFVLSSDYEGVPAVVIEALAAGLPIVATRCSVAMPELLGAGRFGRLVPRRDRRALANAMRSGTGGPASRAAMQRQALRFTIEAGAPAYCDVFRLLADRAVRQADQPGQRLDDPSQAMSVPYRAQSASTAAAVRRV